MYIEGALRVEQKFLRRALDSSPDIKVDYVRLDPRDPKRRPADFADRFKPGKYDVYILGDVDSTAFRRRRACRAGRMRQPRGGPDHARRISDLRARRLRRHAAGQGAAGGHGPARTAAARRAVRTDLHWPGPLKMQPTPLGLMHFALHAGRQAGARTRRSGRNCRRWKGPTSSTISPRAPGAGRAGSDKPLLVAHSFGDGRVMAFAGDSTWRWWMRGFESAFKRFWRQDRPLAGAKGPGAGRKRLDPAGAAAASRPSQRVEFTVGANVAHRRADRRRRRTRPKSFCPTAHRRPLPLVRQGEQMAGSFRDTQTAGDYAIEVTATQKDQPLGSARARFLVFHQDLELDNASADAADAGKPGGDDRRPVAGPRAIARTDQRLTEETQHLEVQQETKKTFWDTWAFFLTLVVAAGVEWYLRKRWGLV